WHTYFVGTPDWGFGLWAHNASYPSSRVGLTRTEALNENLSERDAFWPWRGLHETEGHHPLMQGKSYGEFWKERGFSRQEIDDFVVDLDKDIHRAISEAAPGQLPWWDEQLLTRIITEEAGQNNQRLPKQRVLEIANDLLNEVRQWSP